MKITKLLRFLLIAVAVVMAFSLFACTEPEVQEPEESTSEEINNPTEPTEPTQPTEPQDTYETTEETTETTETPACQHVEETVAGKAATCTEPGLTEGKKCSVCGETLVAQEEIPALGHTEETVAGKAPTCTEPGLTDGKKCSVCGETTVAQTEIPAAHTEEVVPGKAATCTEPGLTEGKKCSVCGETLTAQTEIPAINHANKIDKAFAAPTTAEDGWLAHSACPDCGKVWDAEGKEIDAVPTIAKLTPATNVYFGVEELKNKVIAGAPVDGNPSKFNAPEVSADRTYVRFSRAGASDDGHVMLLEGNTTVTGKFFVLKYRTDHMTSGEFWANTTDNGHSNGKANFNMVFTNDNEWHIIIVDLSKNISNYVQADGEGNYTIQWSRIDLLNSPAESGYFDIAYAVYCDDLSEVASVLQEGDNALCPHYAAATPVYANEGDKHSTACAVCGAKSYENHYAATGTTWSSENKCYTGTCICGAEVVSNMLYKTEPYSSGTADSYQNFLTVTKEDGFIRYTAGATVPSDAFFYPYRHGTAVTGKYMVIKYRVSNNGVNLTTGQRFASSAASGAQPGATGSNQNFVTPDMWIADGNWHTMIIYPKDANVSFTPNADGTYSWGYLRINLNGITPGGYVDIAEIAFADNIIAAENYSLKINPNPVYVANLDQGNCSLNGEIVTPSVRGYYAPIVLDLEGKTVNNAADGLVLGGWLCTPGGVASYKIRVTAIDGEAVAEPTLVDWQNGANRGDIYTAAGKSFGFSDTCAKGAGMNKNPIDLSAYAGKKISFEVVGITNGGAEAVVVQVNNITIAAAQAE